jgi:phage-related protein
MIEKVRPARFYATEAGAEPVREWLRGLPDEDRASIGKDLARVEFGAALRLPLVENLGDGLWEVRTRLRRRRIARVFFALGTGKMVLLHGIIKKSQKTPANDLKTARKRKRLWEKGNA